MDQLILNLDQEESIKQQRGATYPAAARQLGIRKTFMASSKSPAVSADRGIDRIAGSIA